MYASGAAIPCRPRRAISAGEMSQPEVPGATNGPRWVGRPRRRRCHRGWRLTTRRHHECLRLPCHPHRRVPRTSRTARTIVGPMGRSDARMAMASTTAHTAAHRRGVGRVGRAMTGARLPPRPLRGHSPQTIRHNIHHTTGRVQGNQRHSRRQTPCHPCSWSIRPTSTHPTMRRWAWFPTRPMVCRLTVRSQRPD